MFGLSKETILLLDALAAVIGLIILITRFRIHPSCNPGSGRKP